MPRTATPAGLQAIALLNASIRCDGAAAHGVVLRSAEVAAETGTAINYVFYFTVLSTVVVVVATVVVTRELVQWGWLWAASKMATPGSLQRSNFRVATQSQVTYNYVSNPMRSEFRCAPLAERDQVCWSVA